MIPDSSSGRALRSHFSENDGSDEMCQRQSNLNSSSGPKADWDLKDHIAHQIAIRPFSKTELKTKLRKLDLLPKDEEHPIVLEKFEEALVSVGEYRSDSHVHGRFVLRDDMWSEIDPGSYPYKAGARDKVRQLKAIKMHRESFRFLQEGESTELETGVETRPKTVKGPCSVTEFSKPVLAAAGTKRRYSEPSSGDRRAKRVYSTNANYVSAQALKGISMTRERIEGSNRYLEGQGRFGQTETNQRPANGRKGPSNCTEQETAISDDLKEPQKKQLIMKLPICIISRQNVSVQPEQKQSLMSSNTSQQSIIRDNEAGTQLSNFDDKLVELVRETRQENLRLIEETKIMKVAERTAEVGLKELEATNSSLREDNLRVKTAAKESEGRVKELETLNSSSRDEVLRLEGLILDRNNNIKELKTKLSTENFTNQALQRENVVLKQVEKQYSTQIEKLKSRLDDKEREGDAWIKEKIQADEELERLRTIEVKYNMARQALL